MGKSNINTCRQKQKFTAEEDEMIILMFNKVGNQWKVIAQSLFNRTSRQCRERFKYYLSPSINHNKWTAEEDALIVEKVKEYGQKWSHIASLLENRTDIDTKNRWLLLKRAEKRNNEANDIHISIPSNESSSNLFSDEDSISLLQSHRNILEFPTPISSFNHMRCLIE